MCTTILYEWGEYVVQVSWGLLDAAMVVVVVVVVGSSSVGWLRVQLRAALHHDRLLQLHLTPPTRTHLLRHVSAANGLAVTFSTGKGPEMRRQKSL